MRKLETEELNLVSGGFYRGIIPTLPIIQPPIAHMPEDNDDGEEREEQEDAYEEFMEDDGSEWTFEYDEDEEHFHGHEEDSLNEVTIAEDEIEPEL